MSDTWADVPAESRYGRKVAFAMNQVCFDADAKELVRVSNARCMLSHAHAANGGCLLTPCEAIALRVVGMTATRDPIIGWTYRKVRPEALTPVEDQTLLDFVSSIRRSRMIGRV